MRARVEFVALAVLVSLGIFAACSRPLDIDSLVSYGGERQSNPYVSWDLQGTEYPNISLPSVEEELQDGHFPVAGIVSHHLLVGAIIDDWFATLAARRSVERFYILSPRHWDLGSGTYSLTSESWKTKSGQVDSDLEEVTRLATVLQAEIDPEVFVMEHGVDTMMPFIAKYFPSATVVVIAYTGEPPINTRTTERLWNALSSEFIDQQSDEKFILVSSDFSHHGDPVATYEKDLVSRRFLEDPGVDTWIFAGCDNRPAMFVLAALAERLVSPQMTVRYHTNSFDVSGQDRHDITSYFFTYLTEMDYVN